MKMSKLAIVLVIFLGLTGNAFAKPLMRPRFFSGPAFSENITTNQGQVMTTSYTIKFVPLITLLTGLLKTILLKLGQFNNIINRNPVNNISHENVTEEVIDEETNEELSENEEEKYLLECDGSHLGLWPDKSNTQRYYKCEVDPRTPSLGNCLQDYFREREDNRTNPSQQGLLIPVVRPCFMVTMMKCDNGYKYSHKARICIPDVIFN